MDQYAEIVAEAGNCVISSLAMACVALACFFSANPHPTRRRIDFNPADRSKGAGLGSVVRDR